MIGALLVASLVTGFLHGPIPLGKWIPGGSTRASDQYTISAHDQALAKVIALIPPGVRSRRQTRPAAACRTVCTSIPGRSSVTRNGCLSTRLGRGCSTRVKPSIDLPYVEALERTGQFDLVYHAYGVDLFRRKSAK